jgi:hypothetical protein
VSAQKLSNVHKWRGQHQSVGGAFAARPTAATVLDGIQHQVARGELMAVQICTLYGEFDVYLTICRDHVAKSVERVSILFASRSK